MSLIKSSFVVAFFTFLSRIFGFLRDIIIANRMGASLMTDVFFIALRFPNLFRRIFAEGAFSQAFIPIFSRLVEQDDKQKSIVFANTILFYMLVSLTILVIIIEIFMPQIMLLLAPGFKNDPEKFALAVTLTRITFPYLIFVSLVAFYSGILNSFGKFSAATITQIIFNASLIASIYIFSYKNNDAYALSLGVVMAGIFQLIWIIYPVYKRNIKIVPKAGKIDSDVKSMFRKLLPALVGSSVLQINIWVDSIFASLIPNAVSYLYYADRISQLPLAIIGIAIGVVLLPILSKTLATKENNEEAVKIQNNALIFSLIFAVPASIGVIMVSEPIMATLFYYGNFKEIDVISSAQCLSALGFGIIAFVLVKIFSPAFYSRGDTKTPMKIAIVCLFTNIVLNAILINILGFVGIAIATAVSSWVNLLMLVMILIKRKIFYFSREIKLKMFYIFLATILMALFLFVAKHFIGSFLYLDKLDRVKYLGMMILSSMIIFYLPIIAFRVVDIKKGLAYIKR